MGGGGLMEGDLVLVEFEFGCAHVCFLAVFPHGISGFEQVF